MTMDRKLVFLAVLCSACQVCGLIVIIAGDNLPCTPVFMGIAGFAAVTQYFLPGYGSRKWVMRLRQASAICGVLLIVLACVKIG